MEFNTKDLSAYEVRKLGKNEIIKSFDCGDADLNDFILYESVPYRKSLLAVSYVLEHKESGHVLGYFSLANDRVSVADFNSNAAFNRFRKQHFAPKKKLRSYPAVKICRLGIDVSVHGCGIGSMLLDFIKLYFLSDNKTGCRFITVDAYLNAVPFYESNDFQHLKKHDVDLLTRLLFFDLSDIDT